MNLPLYIARRYLFSRKSHNVINVISGISMIGVMTCTIAMVIVLSAFNGIEELVGSLYSAFDSDIQITLKEGKSFDTSRVPEAEMRAIPGVLYYTDVIEESVGLKYRDRQTIAVLKGVEEDFGLMTGIDSMMYAYEFFLQDSTQEYIVVGRGIQNELGTILEQGIPSITVYAIQRGESIIQKGKSLKQNMEEAFEAHSIPISGVFSINAELDTRYTIVPISFAQRILNYGNDVTSIEIGLADGQDPNTVRNRIQAIIGDDFDVKTQYQQNEIIFETTRTEKWITFLMLSFILLIAAFNIIANLSMLVIDKKKDVSILRSIGFNNAMVRNIFFFEGMLITVVGCFAGLFMGWLLCNLQIWFGIIPLEGSVTPYYPVKMIASDFVAVFAIVMAIGILISWVPVHFLTRRHLSSD